MRIAYWRTELSCAIVGDALHSEQKKIREIHNVDTKNSVCIVMSAHSLYLYSCSFISHPLTSPCSFTDKKENLIFIIYFKGAQV
jgi:hypothetical protein